MCKKIQLNIYMILSYVFLSLLSINIQAVEIIFDSTAEGGVGNTQFSGLLLEASGGPDVGVILMHGRTSIPDGAVVRQLRHALNSAGYTTLSIDNPHAGIDANMNGNDRDFIDYINDVNTVNIAFPEAYARIRTAINHLKSLSVEKIVLVGFSMGSRLTSAYIANGQQVGKLPIAAFVGIGMYSGLQTLGPLNQTNNMPAITVPVLEIYGDDDANAATTANERSTAYGGTDYTTTVLDCAADLTTAQCHKLSRLKSNDGEACNELESSAINWIISKVPLTTDQGLGVCATVAPVPAPATGGGGGGGSLSYLLLLLVLYMTPSRIHGMKRRYIPMAFEI